MCVLSPSLPFPFPHLTSLRQVWTRNLFADVIWGACSPLFLRHCYNIEDRSEKNDVGTKCEQYSNKLIIESETETEVNTFFRLSAATEWKEAGPISTTHTVGRTLPQQASDDLDPLTNQHFSRSFKHLMIDRTAWVSSEDESMQLWLISLNICWTGARASNLLQLKDANR